MILFSLREHEERMWRIIGIFPFLEMCVKRLSSQFQSSSLESGIPSRTSQLLFARKFKNLILNKQVNEEINSKKGSFHNEPFP